MTKLFRVGIATGVFVVAPLQVQLSGCDDEPRGACLYIVGDGDRVCYPSVSASCCRQIRGDFHPDDSCSKFPTAKVHPSFTYGGSCL
jgi:hypothetical protein